jgi:hypothetical protein
MLPDVLDGLRNASTSRGCMTHAACVVLQRAIRSMLSPSFPPHGGGRRARDRGGGGGGGGDRPLGDAVAFVADGSLLPRRSGRSDAPMKSPPSVPFRSPDGSDALTRVVTVDVGGFWKRYLNDDGTCRLIDDDDDDDDARLVSTTAGGGDDPPPTASSASSSTTTVTMRGMIIPRGVTLIVGGGYHGKSTLLQALAHGVYDKAPNDGRERCVSHRDAVSVRAEDGRYVNNVNVSAFISNLPGAVKTATDDATDDATVDRGGGGGEAGDAFPDFLDARTRSFGTKDASGSTSQAANVIEALESGASALLVDEDVSAANFMARDGRMRAMIMDEPITPLLYRVNGLFLSKEHGTSTVVVVGGVGEWLDVADAVILMRDYEAHDGLAKARSVSYQFSYGHVQYAGRGVVHRLPWKFEEGGGKNRRRDAENGNDDDHDVGGNKKASSSLQTLPTSTTTTVNATLSPLRRRPGRQCVTEKFKDAAVRLVDSGSSRLEIYRDADDDDGCCADQNDAASEKDDGDEDEDDGITDMSKCMQLVGGGGGGGGASEQLYGCGICVLWLIRKSRLHPEDDISDLLDRMEHALDERGINGLLATLTRGDDEASGAAAAATVDDLLASRHVLDLWATVGVAYRPRRHEVAMVLTRLRGMQFDLLPDKPRKKAIGDGSSSPGEEEDPEESKKRALAELWANRRKR